MLKQLILWKQVNLPSIPRELLSDYSRLKTDSDNDIRIGTPSKFLGIHITGELLDWLKTNISEDAINYSIAWYTANSPTDNTLREHHHDLTRKYVMMYILETGGDDVRTEFFKIDGYPLELDCINKHPGWGKGNYKLTHLDGVKFEPHTWYLMNAKICHSITNLVGERIAIQLSFNDDNFR